MRISDDPRRFAPGARLIHADGRALVVERARDHGDRFLVKFEGADRREAAESLRGALYVPPDEVRELEEGEFWPDELIGCSVYLKSGEVVGEVVDHRSGPVQDLMTVATDKGEALVPLVREIVVQVDVSARRVVIDPPEGLFEVH
ncbi:MAG: ribosome maturation factor RimM [Actinomycetota bacterium]|nr:ribosome maturation factor RimM [Actinomycetota bacterium]